MSQDNQLQQAVLAGLKWDPSVNLAHIGVTANAGIVTLTGHVHSYMEKQAVEKAVRRIKGVKAVAEEIEIRLPFDKVRGDEDIAAAVVDRLQSDVSVHDDTVSVKVEKGWITLTGQVDWHYQKEAVEQDVRLVSGLIGVSNQITVKPRANALNISDDIMHAMHRSWFFDSRTINVAVDGGKVILSGNVRSLYEREVAEDIAWGSPGAIDVENDILVA